MLHHVNCSCLPQFSFFLNLSVTCWLAVGRLSVTCRSTDCRQLTDSWPTGFLGSSSSQLPFHPPELFDFLNHRVKGQPAQGNTGGGSSWLKETTYMGSHKKLNKVFACIIGHFYLFASYQTLGRRTANFFL